MKIAILGGSFNPPHIGHVLIATQIKELFSIDEVWLMPTCIHPFGKKMIAARERLAMARLLEKNFIKLGFRNAGKILKRVEGNIYKHNTPYKL